MTDRISKVVRSYTMSQIRSSNTKPEIKVRSLLHSLGYRFRIHKTDILGKPDIVLKKYGAVIFVHGCFWHSHRCRDGKFPKSNKKYWIPKLKRNVERFKEVKAQLKKIGWKVIIIWECEITNWNQKKLVSFFNKRLKNE